MKRIALPATSCEQSASSFTLKFWLSRYLTIHPSTRQNTRRFGRVCDPLTRFPLRKRTRLIRQSLGLQKKRASSFARFPTNPLFRKIHQVQGGYMTRTKLLVLVGLVLALVAVGHHQL